MPDAVLQNFVIFSSIVVAIVLEAMPFLLLGSILGAAFEVYMSRDTIERFVPRSIAGRVLCGITAGAVLPTCECGVVPIVRRMMGKGVPASVAVPYMLAAPVVNPVVLVSTYVAFQGDWSMLGWRVFFVAVPAMVLGVMFRKAGAGDLLKGIIPLGGFDAGCSCDCGAAVSESKFLSLIVHAGNEFLDMAKFLILGACAAALFKTFVPPDVVTSFSGSLFPSVVLMMVLAVVLCVCSEADAFVAASFSMFPKVSLVSFIALGPMLDIKLAVMFLAVFKLRPALWIMVVPLLTVLLMSVILGSLGVV